MLLCGEVEEGDVAGTGEAWEDAWGEAWEEEEAAWGEDWGELSDAISGRAEGGIQHASSTRSFGC